MKVLAIGDIHTKIWIIDAVEKIIDNYDAVVFCGDYADDWRSSAVNSLNTWYALKNLKDKYPKKVNLVLGNHDYIYVNKTPTLQSGYNNITQLLINSPDNLELKEWLQTLPITLKLDGVTFSHAGLNVFYTEGHDLWDKDSPLWTRPGDEDYQDIPQVFGHTPNSTCWEVQKNVWCIDTFSTYPNSEPIGDGSVLEITNGKKFNIIKLDTKNGNDSISSF